VISELYQISTKTLKSSYEKIKVRQKIDHSSVIIQAPITDWCLTGICQVFVGCLIGMQYTNQTPNKHPAKRTPLPMLE